MTIGLIVVCLFALVWGAYATGARHGIMYADFMWREWLNEKMKVQTRPSVSDLYPEKKND